MKFSELELDTNLLKGINDAGFTECLEVQEEAIPQILNRKDVLVQSQTGTGKTAAFLIPTLQLLLNSKENIKSIIIVPTRELAVQIEKEAKTLCRHIKLKTGCFYGGVGYSQQEKMLAKGVDIVIGTPGRMLDFSNQNKMKFKDFGIVVIDEADRLFDMGFMPDIRRMMKKMPGSDKRVTMLFSATLSSRVKHLAWEYMNEAVEIELTPDQLTVENINQRLYHIGKNEKMRLLLGLLKKKSPKNTIIFTNTKSAAFEISNRLEYNGYKSEYLIGDLQQKKRLKIIGDFKEGKIPILVATDVAARGLHVEDLELVVNYDLPTDCESYVHRIGRTARVGKSGEAISFACELFVYGLETIESYINMKIPVEWPEEDIFIDDESAGKFFDFNSIGRKGKGERPTRGKREEKKTLRKTKIRSKNTINTVKQVKEPSGEKSRINKDNLNKVNPNKKTKLQNIKISNHKKFRKNKEIHKKQNSNGNLEERIEYYKMKYGEDFKPSEELIQSEKLRKKSSFIGKIFSVFKR